MKKTLILLALVILAAIAWYLLSPIWRVQELDEVSPVAESAGMSSEQKEQYEEAMEEMKDTEIRKEEEMPPTARVEAQASFVAKAHDVMGQALLIEQGTQKIIRFEDFETINGPNLHIYLAADLSASDFIDLGPIRATKGNANYTVPPGTDTAKYRHVLVWCVPFRVLFSAASL